MKITQIVLNNQTYYIKDSITGYSSISYSPAITTGVTVGTLTIGENTYTVYAPQAQGGSGLNISVTGTDLSVTHT